MNISIGNEHEIPNSLEIPLKQNLDCTWTPLNPHSYWLKLSKYILHFKKCSKINETISSRRQKLLPNLPLLFGLPVWISVQLLIRSLYKICHACSKPANWMGVHWCGCCLCSCMLIKNLMMDDDQMLYHTSSICLYLSWACLSQFLGF